MLQIYEEVSEGAEELDLGGSNVNRRAYCTWFNFKGADQQKKLSVLSGGERNRLQLAKVGSCTRSNYILPDVLALSADAPPAHRVHATTLQKRA